MRKMFSKKQIEEMIKEGQKSPKFELVHNEQFTPEAVVNNFTTTFKPKEGTLYYINIHDADADSTMVSCFVFCINGILGEWKFLSYNADNDFTTIEYVIANDFMKIISYDSSFQEDIPYDIYIFELK